MEAIKTKPSAVTIDVSITPLNPLPDVSPRLDFAQSARSHTIADHAKATEKAPDPPLTPNSPKGTIDATQEFDCDVVQERRLTPVDIIDQELTKCKAAGEKQLTEIDKMVESMLGIVPATPGSLTRDIEKLAEDSVIYVRQIDPQIARQRGLDMQTGLRAHRMLEIDQERQWTTHWRERLNSAGHELKVHHEDLVAERIEQRQLNANERLASLANLREGYARHQSNLRRKFTKSKAKLREVGGQVFTRFWTLDDQTAPVVFRLRLHSLRNTRDKLVGGRYVLHVAVQDSLGGFPIVWKKQGVEGLRYGSTGVIHYQDDDQQTVKSLDMHREVYTTAPARRYMPWPAMCFIFRLVKLSDLSRTEHKVVAWGAMPICDSELKPISGAFVTPLLRGDVDTSIKRWGQIDAAITGDIDAWLCNLYLWAEPVPFDEHPACEGSVPPLPHLALRMDPRFLIQALPEAGGAFDPVLTIEDEPFLSRGRPNIELPDYTDREALLERPDRAMEEYGQLLQKGLELERQYEELQIQSIDGDGEESTMIGVNIPKSARFGETLYIDSDSDYSQSPNDMELDVLLGQKEEMSVLTDGKMDYTSLAVSSRESHIDPTPKKTPHPFQPHAEMLGDGLVLPEGFLPPYSTVKKDFLKAMIRHHVSELFAFRKYGGLMFFVTMFFFLGFLFLRPYIHGFLQVFFLYALQFPYTYSLNWSGIALIYQTSVIPFQYELGLLLVPLLGQLLIALLIFGLLWSAYKLLGSIHPVFWRFALAFALVISLDPILCIVYDICFSNYTDIMNYLSEYTSGTPMRELQAVFVPDILKLIVHYYIREGNAIPGTLITILGLITFIFAYALFIYNMFVHVYDNSSVMDTFYRLSDPHDTLFVPPDSEVSGVYIRKCIDDARRYRDSDGVRRRFISERYELRDAETHKPLGGALSHLAIYNKQPLSSLSDVHRRFIIISQTKDQGQVKESLTRNLVIGRDLRVRIFELDPEGQDEDAIPLLPSARHRSARDHIDQKGEED